MDWLRTFGIIAHVDAGKTTLTERILFDTGAQRWLGNVDEGTAAMDWMPAERSRGISITAAATRVSWAGHTLQIVDTPGHVDFVAEVQRSLLVLDAVVVVVDGVRGIESQTEAVWQLADERGLSKLVFINKLDREGADFARVAAEIAVRFHICAVPLVIPLLDADGAFAGLGDALSGAVQWFDGTPARDLLPQISAALRAAHERLVEVAADADDAVLAAVVANRTVDVEVLRRVLRQEVAVGRLVIVLGGSALWNRGVDWLLDAVVSLLPTGHRLPPRGLWAAERAGDPAAPFCGFVFKVQHVAGAWNFLRVVRGTLTPGAQLMRGGDPTSVVPVNELCLVRGDQATPVAAAGPGEIVVLTGELGVRTGDTLCALGHAVVLECPKFAAPVLAMAFEPERAEDLARLATSLRELATDDPTLRVERQQGRILVMGMGELHLEVVADLVRERAGIRFACSHPMVDLREVPTEAASAIAEARAIVEGLEHTATCEVVVTPQSGVLPAEVLAGASGQAASAVVAELQQMVLLGRPVPLHGARVGLRALAWTGGSAPLVPLLEQAAARALQGALAGAVLAVLEPWVAIDLWCPEAASPPVLADLAARGAQLHSVSAGGLGMRARGRAPLSRMLGYITRLRSITKGRGRVLLRPDGYELRL